MTDSDNMYKSKTSLHVNFTQLSPISNDILQVIFNNTRSLHLHYEDVKSDPHILNAHIMAFAESRLCSTDLDDTYTLPGYKLIRNDQITVRGTPTSRPPHGLAYISMNNSLHI